MRRSLSRIGLILLLAALIAAALWMGGCRREERLNTPSPAASQDADGAQLDALLEELERLNAASDPLDDLETLDDLDAYAPPGSLLAGEPVAPQPAENTPAPVEQVPQPPAETPAPSVNSPTETPSPSATLPAPTESPLGIELQALLDSLAQEIETDDPLDDLDNIP